MSSEKHNGLCVCATPTCSSLMCVDKAKSIDDKINLRGIQEKTSLELKKNPRRYPGNWWDDYNDRQEYMAKHNINV